MYSRPKKAFTASPDKYPQGYFKDKPCRKCEEKFTPLAPSHLYCSDKCFNHGQTDMYLMKTYGVTYDWYLAKLEEQNHLCAICGGEGFKMKDSGVKLVVDHDHSVEELNTRGLLCHNCNRGLGLFQDNIESLKSAIKYLEGSTTISKESTHKCVEKPSPFSEGEDIV